MAVSIGNPDAGGVPRRERRWRTAFWVVWAVLLIAKIVLAVRLAPFGDEAWYWQESRHPAWGYSDLPPLTAWLIATGEAAFGHGTLAMRAPFLLLGAALPLLIVRIAARIFGTVDGWRAGMLALGLPLLGTLGIFALPDVPLTFASALALHAIERAARQRKLRDWTLLGLALALAWLAHYRAAMLFAAGLAFFALTARGRSLWRDPGLWLALAIMCLGIVPTLAFNATHAWAALDFQLVQRNPWHFHVDALVQPLEQALVCTPLFYGLLLWALWRTWKQYRCRFRTLSVRPERSAEGAKSKGTDGISISPAARATLNANGIPWDLFLCCAAVPILAYFVLGLFADDTRFRAHWPLPGYLPLLIALPVLLREARVAAWFRIATFALLAFGSVLAFAYLGMAAIPGGADVLARMKAFPQQFVGWREAAAQTRALLAQPRFADSTLVADNFMLAAELDFALDGERPVYTLDHPLNAKHGRAPQLAMWGRDEAGLRALGAEHRVLLVVEPGARRERERAAWLDTLCSRVGDLAPVARLDSYAGRKRYRWYAGVVTKSENIESNPDCIAAKP
ncbi:MAG TPA: glycosyltransferase family 39 protein [Rudaea sp.]|nr:glycosyltransferase family 39 protein [Rudaea sp.]